MKKESNVGRPLVQASLLGEAIDAGPALVFVADDEGRYVAANQHACDVLGYTREELLELTVSDVALGAADAYRSFVAAGSEAGQIVLTRKDGSTFEFEYRAQEARAGGLFAYVSVGWVATASSARRRPSARARD